jgi:hypothetical protein
MKTGAVRRADQQNTTPESFLEEIHRIFESGTLRGARDVAERGLALFPGHSELQRIHHALKPPQVRTLPGYRIPDRRDTYKWIEENKETYRGQWVAVLGTEVIAASPDLEDVRKALRVRSLPYPPLLHFFG